MEEQAQAPSSNAQLQEIQCTHPNKFTFHRIIEVGSKVQGSDFVLYPAFSERPKSGVYHFPSAYVSIVPDNMREADLRNKFNDILNLPNYHILKPICVGSYLGKPFYVQFWKGYSISDTMTQRLDTSVSFHFDEFGVVEDEIKEVIKELGVSIELMHNQGYSYNNINIDSIYLEGVEEKIQIHLTSFLKIEKTNDLTDTDFFRNDFNQIKQLVGQLRCSRAQSMSKCKSIGLSDDLRLFFTTPIESIQDLFDTEWLSGEYYFRPQVFIYFVLTLIFGMILALFCEKRRKWTRKLPKLKTRSRKKEKKKFLRKLKQKKTKQKQIYVSSDDDDDEENSSSVGEGQQSSRSSSINIETKGYESSEESDSEEGYKSSGSTLRRRKRKKSKKRFCKK